MHKEKSPLLEPEAIELLEQYQIPYPSHGLARSPEQAAEIAGQLGYPVVLKVVSPDALHKSDMGGVRTGLESGQVEEAFQEIVRAVTSVNPGARIEGMLVCKQAPPGLEVIAGAVKDSTFGMAIMFGLGGIWSEILKDVTFRLAPLSRHDAEEMINEIRGAALLKGYRGANPCDLEALIELLLAVSRLVTENKNISELDLNPVRVYEKGLMALDARVLLAEI